MSDADKLNLIWVLISVALVFVMQAGFLCLESGLTRRKNATNVAVKNVTDFAVSMMLFWAFGFAVMFGPTWGGWVGIPAPTAPLWPDFANDAKLGTFFLFQAVFCGTAVTILSGAVAERVRFTAYLAFAVVVAGLIYPLFGHWAWAGSNGGAPGWLRALGFVDFAGSTAVHSVGGWCALAGILHVGPRLGRFDGWDGKGLAPAVPASDLPLASLGVMLLWFGWVGFNGGSTLGIDASIPLILVNTMLGGAAGLVVGLLIGRARYGFVQAESALIGPLGGLVAITAGCHAMSPAAALVVGGVGAAVALYTGVLLERFRIDDPVGAIPVHLGAGAWGTLAVALVCDPARLGTNLTPLQQLGAQATGIAVCGVLCLGGGWVVLWALGKIMTLRVSADEERFGLNVAEHGARSDLQDFVSTMERSSASGDLSLRARVEPFTEVGQIAGGYNRLMDTLQRSKADVTDLTRTERQLRTAKDAAELLARQAEESARDAEAANAAKNEFLANMSHEIRTPLHGIMSFASFGLRRSATAEPEKVRDYFGKIDASGRRLMALVNDLLDVAKMEAGRMTFQFAPCDLRATAANVVDEFTSLLSEKDIRVSLDAPAAPVELVADQPKLMQVLRNLLGNAVKFSPGGCEIVLSLRGGAAAATFAVRDCGPGVPEAELETIFDKFTQSSRTKTGGGGTGLGLTICRQIVAGHGGRIWAENHAGGGAVFRVDLPLRPAGEHTLTAA